MKLLTLFALTLAALTPLTLRAAAEKPTAKNCGCACCTGKAVCCCNTADATPAATAAESKIEHPESKIPQRYALRGVVVAVDADKSALRVKHEEIPGFMRAMTMQFKVDAPTLAAAKVGAALTGQMSRQGKDWVLEVVKFLP